MNAPLDNLVLAAFLVFCRIGTCLMIMPGISSQRVPVQVRLFLAIAVSLAIVPMMLDRILPVTAGATPLRLIDLVGTEILTGALVGILGRIYFWALQFAAGAMAASVGFSGVASVVIEGSDAETAIATLVTLSALFLFFVSDLHLEVFRALAGSYNAIPVTIGFGPDRALVDISDTLSDAFLATLRIAGPFIVYGVVINIAIGLVNKLTPSIPIYFISLPFVLAGGLALAYATVPEILHIFTGEIAAFLRGM